MTTPRRFFQENSFYHVYNRGNRKDNIFLQRRDYLRFIAKAKEYKLKFNIGVLCYCLLPNHFHFLLKQGSSDSISKFLSRLSTSYAKYFNLKYDLVGSIFQSRFKAKLIDTEEYLVYLSRYIHLNPFSDSNPRGRNVNIDFQVHEWSSLPVYLDLKQDNFVDKEFLLGFFSRKNPVRDYRDFILAGLGSLGVEESIQHLIIE
jgi:REP element-mobilizing transposase RayT